MELRINVEALKKRCVSVSPRIELRFLGYPAHSLITLPTELLQLSAGLQRDKQMHLFKDEAQAALFKDPVRTVQ